MANGDGSGRGDEALTPLAYAEALKALDIALCEALAVSQGQAERLPQPHIAYSSHIFARMCSHGTSLIRAAPRSRWVQSDHEDWSFSSVACHARALLEGYLFFVYLIDPPSSEAEMKARLNVMHLNDCTRRADLMESLEVDQAELDGFAKQQEELRDRLRGNDYFKSLPAQVQKGCLAGNKPWIKSREQLLELAGLSKPMFDSLWVLYSQHSHVLPLSFYRMEPNGRGSGLENDVDRTYIGAALALSAELLRVATERLLVEFPDVGVLRRGLQSEFAPGPLENAPRSHRVLGSLELIVDLPLSSLMRAMASLLSVQKRSGPRSTLSE